MLKCFESLLQDAMTSRNFGLLMAIEFRIPYYLLILPGVGDIDTQKVLKDEKAEDYGRGSYPTKYFCGEAVYK